jgi:Tfp pilus assembly protein PilO
MTHMSYIDHLTQRLDAIETALERERERLDAAAVEDKVEAVTSLSHLKQQYKTVQERLRKAKRDHAETWSDAHAGFREELDGIADTLERLLTK